MAEDEEHVMTDDDFVKALEALKENEDSEVGELLKMMNENQMISWEEAERILGDTDNTPVKSSLPEQTRPTEPDNDTNIDECIQKLLNDDPSLTQINLNNMKRTPIPQIKRLVEAVAYNTHLEKLSLANLGLYDGNLESLPQVLELNSTLKALNLETNYLSGDFFSRLFQAALTNQTLEEVKAVNQGVSFATTAEKQIIDAIASNRGLIKVSVNLRLPEGRHKIENTMLRNGEIKRILRREAAARAKAEEEAAKKAAVEKPKPKPVVKPTPAPAKKPAEPAVPRPPLNTDVRPKTPPKKYEPGVRSMTASEALSGKTREPKKETPATPAKTTTPATKAPATSTKTAATPAGKTPATPAKTTTPAKPATKADSAKAETTKPAAKIGLAKAENATKPATTADSTKSAAKPDSSPKVPKKEVIDSKTTTKEAEKPKPAAKALGSVAKAAAEAAAKATEKEKELPTKPVLRRMSSTTKSGIEKAKVEPTKDKIKEATQKLESKIETNGDATAKKPTKKVVKKDEDAKTEEKKTDGEGTTAAPKKKVVKKKVDGDKTEEKEEGTKGGEVPKKKVVAKPAADGETPAPKKKVVKKVPKKTEEPV